jgi:GNAT superfamily N-acetyltransferase
MPSNPSAPDAAHLAVAVARESITIAPLQALMARAVQHMTFPAYRHLLSLDVNVRHPEDGDTRRVQPLGAVAMLGDRPIGLALAERPLFPIPPLPPSPKEGGLSNLVGPVAPLPNGDASGATSELLSLYVDASMRGRGVGTALVAALEDAMSGLGPTRLEAVYMTGKADVAAIERVFAKRGWQPPTMRTYTLRFTTDDAERMPWFGRVPLRDRDFEMFAWGDLRQAERDALIASQHAQPWIPEGLEFWRHDHAGFDPVSSLGLRYRGEVVGWTINHQLAADTTRISGAFVRDDLSRRGRLMALWTESITRMKAGGVRWISSITPVQLAPMVAFLARRCAPWATFCGETRGTHIDLLPLTQSDASPGARTRPRGPSARDAFPLRRSVPPPGSRCDPH